jgi:hypothetical protein
VIRYSTTTLQLVLWRERKIVSWNRNDTVLHPFGVWYNLGGRAKSVLALLSSVAVAYTNSGYLGDAYR